jgi:hypothetical protein
MQECERFQARIFANSLPTRDIMNKRLYGNPDARKQKRGEKREAFEKRKANM